MTVSQPPVSCLRKVVISHLSRCSKQLAKCQPQNRHLKIKSGVEGVTHFEFYFSHEEQGEHVAFMFRGRWN